MNCEFEKEIRAALRGRGLNETHEQHLRECEDCHAFSVTQRAMTLVAQAPQEERVLPDPAILWLKGQILRHQRLEARVVRPMRIVQFAAQIAVALGWAALFTWKWPQILSATTDFSVVHFFGSQLGTEFSISAVSVTLTLILITAAITFQAVFAED